MVLLGKPANKPVLSLGVPIWDTNMTLTGPEHEKFDRTQGTHGEGTVMQWAPKWSMYPAKPEGENPAKRALGSKTGNHLLLAKA